MKLKGKKIEGPSVETLVIPREDGDLVFKCQAVLDYDPFDVLCKEPEVPQVTKRGETKPKPDPEDKDYKKALSAYSYKKFVFMLLKSLSATPELEWDTVKMEDPETWGNLETELKNAGLSPAEVGQLFQAITSANGMNEERFKEARARFFSTVVPTAAN